MKLNNLDIRFLTGMVEAFIANYDEHNTPIPAEKYLSYSIAQGLKAAKGGDPNKPIDAVKITFSWIPESRHVCVDESTNSYEDRGESAEDYFTILASDSIAKLQRYVEDVLDKVTKN